jgi:hypothetical protein
MLLMAIWILCKLSNPSDSRNLDPVYTRRPGGLEAYIRDTNPSVFLIFQEIFKVVLKAQKFSFNNSIACRSIAGVSHQNQKAKYIGNFTTLLEPDNI